jgi:hypothetical protein
MRWLKYVDSIYSTADDRDAGKLRMLTSPLQYFHLNSFAIGTGFQIWIFPACLLTSNYWRWITPGSKSFQFEGHLWNSEVNRNTLGYELQAGIRIQ